MQPSENPPKRLIMPAQQHSTHGVGCACSLAHCHCPALRERTGVPGNDPGPDPDSKLHTVHITGTAPSSPNHVTWGLGLSQLTLPELRFSGEQARVSSAWPLFHPDASKEGDSFLEQLSLPTGQV